MMASQMQTNLDSAQAALQSSSLPAQLYGTETLLTLAKTGMGKELLVAQGAIAVLCEGIAEERIKDQAFANALKILEQVTACGVAECASGKACGMPANCVTGMLEIFASSTQPQDARLQAGHITASLLRGHKCQRKALRDQGGLEILANHLKTSKDKDKVSTHLSLEIIAGAVRSDRHAKKALIEKPDVLKSIVELLAFEQTAHPALDVVVALLCSGPGMHTLSRACCSSLCRAGIAGPLVGLLGSGPDGKRCTEVLDILRRLATSGAESLAALREAALLQACLFIVKSAAPGSANAKCAVTLAGRFAQWDDDSRKLLEEAQADVTLLQALHIADFEELPVRHDICEVLAGLQGSDPENCSTGGKLVLHWAAQFGYAELCKRLLEASPLVDIPDERGNTPLHLAALNDHRVALELLFNMNANIKSFNKAQQTPLDLAAPLCDVWELLHEEAEWRNLLERPRPCRVSLVGYEGPAEIAFSPTLGVLTLHGLNAHLKAPSANLRRLLMPRGGAQSPRAGGSVSVPFPHTAYISRPRACEVHLDFNGLDPVLGQTLVPSSSDGRCTVLKVTMRTESAGAAIEMERALQRLQKRIYPDIMALCASFTAYAQMYEQCKADQIDALAQYGALYTAEGQVSAEVGDTIEQLRAQVEDGREGVIDAHRALLDSADAVIAKLCVVRVECEKAEAGAPGGDAPLWEALGDRALAAIQVARAYRERALHAAYSGVLPPQPRHATEDSEGPADPESMEEILSGAAAWRNSSEPPIVSTDKELVIALKELSMQCTEALVGEPVQWGSPGQSGSGEPSTSTAACPANDFGLDLWASGGGRSSRRRRSTSTDAAALVASPKSAPAPQGKQIIEAQEVEGLAAATPPQKAQKRPEMGGSSGSSGSPSEDALSMTGLLASGSESSKQGSRSSSEDTEMSLRSASDESEEQRRWVLRFMHAAPSLAASAMETSPDLSGPTPGPGPKPGAKKPNKSRAARRLSTEFVEPPTLTAERPRATAAAPASATPIEVCVPEPVARSRSLSPTKGRCRQQEGFEMGEGEPCLPFQRAPTPNASKDQKRAGSFTFARQAPRAGSEQSEFTFRRATASEPCEAMAFPRLGRHHPSPLSHHASLAKLAGDEERPGGKLLPDAGQLSALLDTSNSSQWTADTMHANMAETLTQKMDALGEGEDGMAKLQALLGSDEWAALGSGSAQATLAQASSAVAAPALPCEPGLGRPPLPDTRPRRAKSPAPASPSMNPPTSSVPAPQAEAVPVCPPLPAVRTQEAQAPAQATPQTSRDVLAKKCPDPGSIPMSEEGRAEFVKSLTAEIARAAQQVALGAISSSVDVAGEAVKELPSWAGPDVIIAATMSKLDSIVASAIESGVAQAAALATSMSADDLANKLHERKQGASPAASPRGPAGLVPGSPGAVKGPISARFPAFAEQGRKAVAVAHVPKLAIQSADSPAAPDSPMISDAQPCQPEDMALEESAAATEQAEPLDFWGGAKAAQDAGADSDGSSASNDAKLHSPPKKAKQLFGGQDAAAGLPVTCTQDLVPLVMEPFGQAAISALAMQQGSFGAGTLNNTGSAGKVSPRRKKERSRAQHGRSSSRQLSAGDSFSALTGTSSMSSGALASVGQQFESALLDSNCSEISV